MDEVGPRGSCRGFRRARWGWGPASGRAEMPAWPDDGDHGSFFQHLCRGCGAGNRRVGSRGLVCLQLMEVAPDVTAPWGGTGCAMTPESPL